MTGLRQTAKRHGKMLILLTAVITGMILRGCYLRKKENYNELWRVQAEHEARIQKLEGK